MYERKVQASPSLDDWKREFGDKVKCDGNGNFEINLKDRQDIRRAHEMQEGARRIEVERGYELHSREKKQRVIRKDGRITEVTEQAERVGRHNIRPLGRNGVSAAERFSFFGAAQRYEQGPDGLWFVWSDGWDATNLWRKENVRSPQRDPDGNVWVEVSGEWQLQEEVA